MELKRGDAGYRVTVLQTLLYLAGFPPGPIDGIFGPKTEAALVSFQRTSGLADSGRGDKAIMDALYKKTSLPEAPIWGGKHVWIWYLEKCENGNLELIGQKAKNAGVRGLLIKAHDGGSVWTQFAGAVSRLKDHGFTVGAWGYCYGRDVPAEASAALASLGMGADWYVIDAEIEFETRAGAEKAKQLCQLIRDGAPDATIGFSSFPVATYHPLFPYKIFSSYCDVSLPQVYWAAVGWPLERLWTRTLNDNLPFGRPLAPVGQTFGPATPADVEQFGRMAGEVQCAGISFWSWQHASPEQWNAISRVSFPGNTGTENTGDDAWDPAEEIARLREAGLVKGHHAPDDKVTWGELATVLNRLRGEGRK